MAYSLQIALFYFQILRVRDLNHNTNSVRLDFGTGTSIIELVWFLLGRPILVGLYVVVLMTLDLFRLIGTTHLYALVRTDLRDRTASATAEILPC